MSHSLEDVARSGTCCSAIQPLMHEDRVLVDHIRQFSRTRNLIDIMPAALALVHLHNTTHRSALERTVAPCSDPNLVVLSRYSPGLLRPISSPSPTSEQYIASSELRPLPQVCGCAARRKTRNARSASYQIEVQHLDYLSKRTQWRTGRSFPSTPRPAHFPQSTAQLCTPEATIL